MQVLCKNPCKMRYIKKRYLRGLRYFPIQVHFLSVTEAIDRRRPTASPPYGGVTSDPLGFAFSTREPGEGLRADDR